jgi:hypothetical protein
MRIQLFIQQYQATTEPFEDCQRVEINQVNAIPDASCNLLHVGNCLDFIQNSQEALPQFVKKLRYGGQIVIEGVDLVEVGMGVSNNTLPIPQAQSLLFSGRQSCTTMDIMIQVVRQLGLRPIKTRLMQYKYLIRAERPNAK